MAGWCAKSLGIKSINKPAPAGVSLNSNKAKAVVDPEPNAISDGPIIPQSKGTDIMSALISASAEKSALTLKETMERHRRMGRATAYNWDKEPDLSGPLRKV